MCMRCRESEQKLLGGSSSGSDPDLGSLVAEEEERGAGSTGSQQDAALAPAQGTSPDARQGRGQARNRPNWWVWAAGWIQRADEESWLCYVLFVLLFILDFSLLTMLFPVSLAAYALATQKPSQRYWQVRRNCIHTVHSICHTICRSICQGSKL